MNNPHQNARTTFYSRALIVQRVLKEGESVKEVAEALGVSRRTVYKWLARYKSGGQDALYDRSSRPRGSPRRLPVGRVATIAAMRRMRMNSPQIAFSLSMPLSTVTLELRRLGLNRLSRLEPKPPVIRYEHKAPGDMIHLDVKKLGKIDGVGHRIHGDRSRRKRGIGWEYLHVCVDDHSRLAYTELLPDEKATTATCFLIRAADWLGRHGVRVRRVMTDNGSCYRSYLFNTAVQSLGARQVRTRPYTPRTNGKAERFIQTSIKEWAYKRAYETSEERNERLGPWLDYYNQTRPHTALKYKPPISRLANCEQRPC
ncbi:MAG: IS481 family transposase [Proteobacteria bacterium]|nr:IS481 family transposase [Pseudomonadota bacterium]